MNYQLYQIFLFFSIYSIVGFIINFMYRAIVGETSTNTKACKGPYCPAYGVGVLILIFVMGFAENEPPMAFAAGAVIGGLVEAATILLTKLCSGRKTERLKWYHPLLWGAGGTILMTHIHQLVEVATNRISPWIHFGFLVVFLIVFISDYVDGIWNLLGQRKNGTTICRRKQ